MLTRRVAGAAAVLAVWGGQVAVGASVGGSGQRAVTRVVADAPGVVGVAASCDGGPVVAANAAHRSVAASTLKAPVVAYALSLGLATSDDRALMRAAIVESSNDATNAVLARLGGSDAQLGAERATAWFRTIGLRESRLDGPYRLSSGPSRKFTSARDLHHFMASLDAAQGGAGALASSGLSRADARFLIGLLGRATYPGLVRPFTSDPVAHKAGWLDGVQNDAVLIQPRGGLACVVGITTEGLSYESAADVGRAVVTRVLPAIRADLAAGVELTTPDPERAARPGQDSGMSTGDLVKVAVGSALLLLSVIGGFARWRRRAGQEGR